MIRWSSWSKYETLFLSLVFGISVVLLPGCAASRQAGGTPLRPAIEQLLLSQALQRSLPEVSLPIPADATVFVEAVGLTRDHPADQEYARQAIALQLSHQGFRLVQKEEEATYRVKVLLQTFGIEQEVTFFGMPPVQSLLIPVSLPELALYKDFHQSGLVRFSVSVFERSTGRLISTSPWYSASTYYNNYTIFIAVTWNKTDLELPE